MRTRDDLRLPLHVQNFAHGVASAIIGLCRIPHGEECLLFALVCFHLTPAREIGQGGPFNDLKGISFSCNYSTEKFLKRSLRTDSIEDIA